MALEKEDSIKKLSGAIEKSGALHEKPPLFSHESIALAKKTLTKSGVNLNKSKPHIPGFKNYNDLFNAMDKSIKNSDKCLEDLNLKTQNDKDAKSNPLPHDPKPFPHYVKSIRIYPDQFKFETKKDLLRWILIGGGNRLSGIYRKIAKFIFHDEKKSYKDFVYKLKGSNGSAKVALFSDWGTGYYHSEYIVKHIKNLQPGQAIHLGDVYYDGTNRFFKENFTPFLSKHILPNMPFYALNANHEMAVGGQPYFDFIKMKHEKGKNGEYCKQPQQGSYFSLENDHFQIIGIDTAYQWPIKDDYDVTNTMWGDDEYYEDGRFNNKKLRKWLKNRLNNGKDQIRILLSQHEPFSDVKRELLRDMGDFKDKIHMWFWGDEHYCALFEPNGRSKIPFYGSCIGHGGYPYELKLDVPNLTNSPAQVVWQEKDSRFYFNKDLRQSLGNNGFCMLELNNDKTLKLEYIDWTRRTRKTCHFSLNNKNRLTLDSHE